VTVTPDRSFPYPLGVSLRDGRVNVAIYRSSADSVEFCVFADAADERRVQLTERTGHVFHGLVPDIGPGTKYALRVDGPWNPSAGLRHKLLLDPHARAVSGGYTWGQAAFGHDLNDHERMDETDGAGSTPLCVATADDFDWGDDKHPLTPLAETSSMTRTSRGSPNYIRTCRTASAAPTPVWRIQRRSSTWSIPG